MEAAAKLIVKTVGHFERAECLQQVAGQKRTIRQISGADCFTRIGIFRDPRPTCNKLRGDVEVGVCGGLADTVLDPRGWVACPTDNPQHCAPVFERPTYQRIQDIRADRTKISKRADLGQDFILRGAVLCAECDAPYRSAWSKGKYKKYAYYVCQTKDCESYGKSIPRAEVESAFEDILKEIAPTSNMITIARKMCRKLWDTRVAQAKAQGRTIKEELKALETRMQKTLDRIVGADSAAVASALEQKYNEMELQRAVLAEKAAIPSSNSHHFNEKLELSLQFLANPWKIWDKGSFELRRTVLKLVLTHPFRYHRKTGPRTPEISFPFNALTDNCDQFGKMVRMRRLELPRVLPHSDLNAARLPFRHIRTLGNDCVFSLPTPPCEEPF